MIINKIVYFLLLLIIKVFSYPLFIKGFYLDSRYKQLREFTWKEIEDNPKDYRFEREPEFIGLAKLVESDYLERKISFNMTVYHIFSSNTKKECFLSFKFNSRNNGILEAIFIDEKNKSKMKGIMKVNCKVSYEDLFDELNLKTFRIGAVYSFICFLLHYYYGFNGYLQSLMILAIFVYFDYIGECIFEIIDFLINFTLFLFYAIRHCFYVCLYLLLIS